MIRTLFVEEILGKTERKSEKDFPNKVSIVHVYKNFIFHKKRFVLVAQRTKER